ncbi:helix-turn-helix domain-containing protein [Halorussus salinus]|uniref:helix-turn-helix domain-containing protein n=1 Tax=Halorussus salinus TaxID=1364935 RepID=UPI001092FB0B|nr:helix-turn-helix domain-containing protein [Halorussus salinus]
MSRDEDDESNCADVPRRPYSLFVRAELAHSELPLSPALARSPGTTARPRSAILDGDRFFVAGLGDRLDAFEEGLAADPTVADPVVVSEFEDRRLYRVRVTAAGRERLDPLESAAAFVHDASGTRDGWTVRMELEDRDALVGFVRNCRAVGIDLDVRRITDTEGVERHHSYGLSAEQERILRTAYERGYYDVPRRVSQTDLADSFGLSTSAVSQHLRRATAELVGNALLPRRGSR